MSYQGFLYFCTFIHQSLWSSMSLLMDKEMEVDKQIKNRSKT